MVATFDMKEYARRGAEVRLAELNAELAEIFRAFPELQGRRGARTSRAVVTTVAIEPGAGDGTVRRRRRRRAMTTAQRKAVGERMRKYWAARRKAKATK